MLSCGGDKCASNNTAKVMSGDIKIDGSSTVYRITEATAKEFRTVAPKVKVTIGISGTGGGLKKFGRGETDISDASRPIKDTEAAACAENNIANIQLLFLLY